MIVITAIIIVVMIVIVIVIVIVLVIATIIVVIKQYYSNSEPYALPVSVRKTLLLRKPSLCSPTAETALEPLIWCSESLYSQGSSSPEGCFCFKRRYDYYEYLREREKERERERERDHA